MAQKKRRRSLGNFTQDDCYKAQISINRDLNRSAASLTKKQFRASQDAAQRGLGKRDLAYDLGISCACMRLAKEVKGKKRGEQQKCYCDTSWKEATRRRDADAERLKKSGYVIYGYIKG